MRCSRGSERKVCWISGLVAAGIVWISMGGRPCTGADDAAAVAHARNLSAAFRSAAKKVVPTVVKIEAISKPRRDEEGARAPRSRENPFKGTPFEEFFGDDDGPGFRFRHPGPQRGIGSGVIVDPSGVILTNNHVVEGADEVVVSLSDGRELKAQAADIKTDEQSDIAVVRVRTQQPLPAAKLGDSETIDIGDWVLAIGNPFELGGTPTVSAGIISAKERVLPSSKRASFLQTDAAINPGNSGGPLVNLDGEVIGINTAIASSSGGYQGVGFAIPISLAKWVADQLIRQGSVQRAYLGVSIGEVTNEVARHFGVEPNRGVLVSEVFPNSPAAAGGFKEGDIVTAFAGQQVHNPRELQQLVERAAAGSRQRVDIIRDGKPQTLEVVVKALPQDFGVASTPAPRRQPRGDAGAYENRELGLEVGELTAEMAERLGYKGFSGVVVSWVDPKGIAAGAGLAEGMVILRVGKRAVRSVAEFKAALQTVSLKEGIMLLVRTPGGNRFLVLQSG